MEDKKIAHKAPVTGSHLNDFKIKCGVGLGLIRLNNIMDHRNEFHLLFYQVLFSVIKNARRNDGWAFDFSQGFSDETFVYGVALKRWCFQAGFAYSYILEVVHLERDGWLNFIQKLPEWVEPE